MTAMRYTMLLAVLCAGCDGQAGGRKMAELHFENGLTTETRSVTPRPIRPASPERLPPSAPDSAAEFHRPFGNSRANSRVSRALPKGEWRLRWKADLDPAFTPYALLEAGDRILVQSGEWRLFTRDGQLVARERSAGTPIVAETSSGLFYRIAQDSYLAAARLSDGEAAFRFLPAYGDQFSRVHVGRNGTRIAIAGFERDLAPHGQTTPKESLVEVNDLGPSPVPDGLGFLSSLVPLGVLHLPSPHLVAASTPEHIVAAQPGRVYLIRWDLQVDSALEGEFDPQALSLDEAGRFYLLARKAGGDHSLLLLKPSGERLYSWDLPKGASSSIPPVIGYDHTAYVIAGSHIFAVTQDGTVRWNRASRGPVAGAVVTADGLLLATEGSSVASYESRAERNILVKGDAFVTPPLLTRGGDLLVASKTALYCYSAAAK